MEETLRAIDAQIGYHKNQIKELNAAKKEILDNDIPYTKNTPDKFYVKK